jgi:hypothetical protein
VKFTSSKFVIFYKLANELTSRVQAINGIFVSFASFWRSYRRIIILILVTVLLTLVISATMSIVLSRFTNLSVPSVGNIRAIGVEAYWEFGGENKTEIVDWGTIFPGLSKNVTLYVKSVSNVETTLNLTAMNWNPPQISDYLNLSWSYDGTPLEPGEVIQVTLTLSTSSSTSLAQYLIVNDVRSFDFDIDILATELE